MRTNASGTARGAPRHVCLLAFAVLLVPPAQRPAGPVSVTPEGDALKISAPGFTFLDGQPLARLQDGHAVRVELGIAVLPAPGKTPVTTSQRVFAVSYDLWEERFAVTAVNPRSESISHLTAAAAVAWCLDQLSIPLSALNALRRGDPFWIRLEYRILDGERPGGDEDSGFTLQTLIDVLSRRSRAESARDAIEAGPFRLPPGGAPPLR